MESGGKFFGASETDGIALYAIGDLKHTFVFHWRRAFNRKAIDFISRHCVYQISSYFIFADLRNKERLE